MSEKTPYSALASAVILRAIKDNEEAWHTLERNRENTEAKVMLEDTLSFFSSELCDVYLSLAGMEIEKDELEKRYERN